MATQGINRVVRGNLTLKPFILSKNSTNIVNGYVQRLYQQLPENFKQDLMKPRTAESQHATWASWKNLHVPATISENPTRVKSKNARTNGNKAGMTFMPSGNNLISAQKKLLKTPNLKIYNKRKYTSSASSSNASFQRNNNVERKKRLTGNYGITTRSINSSAISPQKPADISTYAAIAGRLFNARTKLTSARATTEICKDLMPVNAQLKKKISLSKPKQLFEILEMSRPEGHDRSFNGWNHPSPEHFKKLTTSTSVRKPPPMSLDRGMLNLMEFKRMPVSAKARFSRCETNNMPPYKKPQLSALKNRSDDSLKSVKPSGGRNSSNFKFGNRIKRTDSRMSRTPRVTNTSCLAPSTVGRTKRETSFTFRK